MAALNQTLKEKVLNLIDERTKDYLGIYEINDIKSVAEVKMNNTNKLQDIADTVCDFISEKYEDKNIIFAVALQQCMPADEVILLRNQIIAIE